MSGAAEACRLLDEIRACRRCEGLPLGPKPILKFHAKARVLIAGQAPGRLTHAQGLPFDDASGARLRDWLGVDRATFYGDDRIAAVPMGFCYPGRKGGGDAPPRPECAALWRPRVLAAMPDLGLTIVLGRYAMEWTFPETRGRALAAVSAEWRGLWPEAVVLPHPSPRNTLWLRRNPWVDGEIVPRLRRRVAALLG